MSGFDAEIPGGVDDETDVASARLEALAHGVPHLARLHAVADVSDGGEGRLRVDDVLLGLGVGEGGGDDPKVLRFLDLGADRHVGGDELLEVRETPRIGALDQRQDLVRVSPMAAGEIHGGVGRHAPLEVDVQLDLGPGFEVERVEGWHFGSPCGGFREPYVCNRKPARAFI